MPQFNTTFWFSQIFWMLLSFGTLYLGVRFIIFPMLDSIFKKRSEKIASPLEKAEELVSETQKIQDQIEQKKQDFHVRCTLKLEHAQQQASKNMQRALEKQEKEFSLRLKHQVKKAEEVEKKILSNSDITQQVLKGAK